MPGKGGGELGGHSQGGSQPMSTAIHRSPNKLCRYNSTFNLQVHHSFIRKISPFAQQAIRSFPLMLSQQWNHFRLCSASNEIISAYAQPAMKSFPCMLSKRWNRFLVCSAVNEIISALAQHAFGCPCKNGQNLKAGWADVDSVCD